MNRSRRDLSNYARLTERALDIRMSEDLPADPPMWDQLRKRQKAMVLLGALYRYFAFFADTGVGKTFASIVLMLYFQRRKVAQKFLVLVPNVANKTEWAIEGFDKHAPDFHYCVLSGSTEEKWKQLEESGADCFIETYTGLMYLLCTKQKDKRQGKSKKIRMTPNAARIKKMQKLIDGVICDESTFLKDADSLYYRLCKRLRNTAKVFFLLTGTPFGRNPMDLWSQMYLVDLGYTLGETFGLFRQAFFDSVDEYWGGRKWTFSKGMEPTLNRFLADSAITIEADPDDLPFLVPVKKYCELPKDAVLAYEEAKEQMKASGGDYMEMKNAFMRSRQISSGFVGFWDDDAGKRAEHEFAENPKLDRLEWYITDTIRRRYKFIVFHEFHHSGEVICKMLKRLKIGHRLLNGNSKDPDEIKRAFKYDDSVEALVLNNNAGGFGLNLQNARYGLYYEAPVSAIVRKQTQRRFERQYSLFKNVFLVDFITRGTSDETILSYHAEGRALWKSILKVGQHDRMNF